MKRLLRTAADPAAQQLRNGENIRFLKFLYCDGAGNFHWVKVAQAELQAVVVWNTAIRRWMRVGAF